MDIRVDGLGRDGRIGRLVGRRWIVAVDPVGQQELSGDGLCRMRM